MRRLVSIYQRKSKLLFRACSQTPNPFWVGVGECTVLKVGATAPQVGEAVRERLAVSGTIDWQLASDGELLAAAGVSAWTRFYPNSKRTTLAAEGDEITVTPYDRRGSVYWPANAEAIRISAGSDVAVLGETVLRVLANST
jgi:hypothetical protein